MLHSPVYIFRLLLKVRACNKTAFEDDILLNIDYCDFSPFIFSVRRVFINEVYYVLVCVLPNAAPFYIACNAVCDFSTISYSTTRALFSFRIYSVFHCHHSIFRLLFSSSHPRNISYPFILLYFYWSQSFLDELNSSGLLLKIISASLRNTLAWT